MQREPSVHKQCSPAEHCIQDKWTSVFVIRGDGSGGAEQLPKSMLVHVLDYRA